MKEDGGIFLSGNFQLANTHSPGEAFMANPTHLPAQHGLLSLLTLGPSSDLRKPQSKQKFSGLSTAPLALGNLNDSKSLIKVYSVQQDNWGGVPLISGQCK